MVGGIRASGVRQIADGKTAARWKILNVIKFFSRISRGIRASWVT